MKRALYTTALVLTLAIAVSACAKSTPAPTTTEAPTTTSPSGSTPTKTTTPSSSAPSGQTPKYGGTIQLAQAQDISSFDDATQGGPGGVPNSLFTQELWGGDWTKGNAGGYGTKATDWGSTGYDTVANQAGYLAQSWAINVDNDKG